MEVPLFGALHSINSETRVCWCQISWSIIKSHGPTKKFKSHKTFQYTFLLVFVLSFCHGLFSQQTQLLIDFIFMTYDMASLESRQTFFICMTYDMLRNDILFWKTCCGATTPLITDTWLGSVEHPVSLVTIITMTGSSTPCIIAMISLTKRREIQVSILYLYVLCFLVSDAYHTCLYSVDVSGKSTSLSQVLPHFWWQDHVTPISSRDD